MTNPKATDHQPIKILIAEDSPTQAQRLRHILEKAGYLITHAANGRLALDAALRDRPTIIISDVVMPEMDGYEFCRRVKAEPSLKGVPVILVTTLSDPGDVIRGLECCADNFILKPYEAQYLLGRVQFVLVNREMHQSEHMTMGVEIVFNGNRHFITADRLQMLNLLLSTYEAAIQRNKELTRAHEDLKALNGKLELANKELEAFSYSVSHDLRAPLRHIAGFAGLLEQSVAGKLNPKEQGHLKTIIDSATQMGRLIDDLLDFSRMGRVEVQRTVVDLNMLVPEVVRSLGPELRERKITWKVGPLPQVRADPAMMRQVLVNLLANAIKYTRTRPAAEIVVSAQSNPTEHVISVRDNGVGFEMKYADKLFGVFQRLHRAEEFEGTGVGLANVRRIVSRHGGRTWAESKLGEGATFFFTLPITE